MAKIKILFMINGLRMGGMERQLVEMIKALQSTDIKPYLAILNSPGPYSEIAQQQINQPILYLDRRKTKIFNTLIKLSKYVKQEKIDIIHVQDSFSSFYALPLSKLLSIPFVNCQIQHAGVSKGIEYFIGKVMLKMSNVIISNSQAGLKYYKIKDGYVLYNFIDQNRFNLTQGSIHDIVMTANLHHLKDHITFFRAIKKLYDLGRVKSVGLIGDGPYKLKYQHLVKNLGISHIVSFYGFINNVEEIIIKYGIGVLCSTKKYQEGISNSLLEYMGAGLIAVGSDIGGTSEIIKNGENGFLFEVENPDSLVDKIIAIQDEKICLNRIRDSAYSTIRTNHSPIDNINRYEIIVKTYLDEKTRSLH